MQLDFKTSVSALVLSALASHGPSQAFAQSPTAVERMSAADIAEETLLILREMQTENDALNTRVAALESSVSSLQEFLLISTSGRLAPEAARPAADASQASLENLKPLLPPEIASLLDEDAIEAIHDITSETPEGEVTRRLSAARDAARALEVEADKLRDMLQTTMDGVDSQAMRSFFESGPPATCTLDQVIQTASGRPSSALAQKLLSEARSASSTDVFFGNLEAEFMAMQPGLVRALPQSCLPPELGTAFDLAQQLNQTANAAGAYNDAFRDATLLAMSTGNPYIIAAVMVLQILDMILGGGDGDGDGDDGKGKPAQGAGEVPGPATPDRAPNPSSSTVPPSPPTPTPPSVLPGSGATVTRLGGSHELSFTVQATNDAFIINFSELEIGEGDWQVDTMSPPFKILSVEEEGQDYIVTFQAPHVDDPLVCTTYDVISLAQDGQNRAQFSDWAEGFCE